MKRRIAFKVHFESASCLQLVGTVPKEMKIKRLLRNTKMWFFFVAAWRSCQERCVWLVLDEEHSLASIEPRGAAESPVQEGGGQGLVVDHWRLDSMKYHFVSFCFRVSLVFKIDGAVVQTSLSAEDTKKHAQAIAPLIKQVQ